MAILSVFLIPILVDLAVNLQLSYGNLKIPIIGGIFYLIFLCFYRNSIPSEILTNKNKEEFQNLATTRNTNIFIEYKNIIDMDKEKIKKQLKENSSLFFPPEKGLQYSRDECIRSYAGLQYDFLNTSKTTTRLLVSLGMIVSLILINWLSIERLYRVIFGGAT